jgi:SAM-dependent methyltransferase
MINQLTETSIAYWVWQASELQINACSVCGSEKCQPIYRRMDNLDIVVCELCSFRFVQPQPSQQELNRFYEQGYFTGNHDFHQGNSYFAAREAAIETEEVTGWQFLKSHVSLAGKSVLDLGCADGALLVLACQAGASEVKGVEVSPEAAQHGRSQYGLEILETSADILPFPDKTFNVVTAFDLIEHVRQPAQLFQEVNRVLSPGGLFVGGCPDMGCFDDWQDEWTGVIRNMEHLSYFDDKTLSKIADRSNFQLLNLECRGFPLPLRQYSKMPLPSKLQKVIQPTVWIHNLWQKSRVRSKRSNHKHELLFVLQKR